MKLFGLALLLVTTQGATRPAERAYEEALDHLRAGEGVAAEASAREALALSLRFEPEGEISSRPDKGILFEDMILEARKTYRERRSRYFRALGDALAAQERWRASRKAYRRAAGIQPSAEILLRMATHEDLKVEERVDLLLEAYLTPGADRSSLQAKLLETGAFRNRNALKASLDRRRFAELQASFGELELLPGSFPELQTVTDAGVLNTGQLFREGSRLFVYAPAGGCRRCSEELEALSVPALEARRRERPVTLAAFVPEGDLSIARRIVRLLAIPVGVGRSEGLPPALRFAEGGEIRIVARGGLTQIRLPTAIDLPGGEIRRRVEAVLEFLDAPVVPSEEKPEEAARPLVTLERGANDYRTLLDWIGKLERLEAGVAPLGDLYRELERLTQQVVRAGFDREAGFDLLGSLSRLRGANGAKSSALGTVGDRLTDRLLERARELNATVRRTAPGEQGLFFVAVDASAEPRRVYIQRSFQTTEGFAHAEFVLEDVGSDLKIAWAAAVEDQPRGVAAVQEGGVFHFGSEEGCNGLRLVTGEGVAHESCTAAVIDGELVEVESALVDEVAGGPRFYRYGVTTGGEETALERGLRLFDASDFAGAESAFQRAAEAIDPIAPYDASDLLYNRARALEERGERQQALALYRSLGDVSYQEFVDERAARIESGR